MIDPRKESARVEKAYQQWQSFRTAYDYAAGILSGAIVANAERIEAAERFFRDLLNPTYDIRMKPPEFVIRIIERTIKHNQGEKLDGTPLKGTPLIVEPWQRTSGDSRRRSSMFRAKTERRCSLRDLRGASP